MYTYIEGNVKDTSSLRESAGAELITVLLRNADRRNIRFDAHILAKSTSEDASTSICLSICHCLSQSSCVSPHSFTLFLSLCLIVAPVVVIVIGVRGIRDFKGMVFPWRWNNERASCRSSLHTFIIYVYMHIHITFLAFSLSSLYMYTMQHCHRRRRRTIVPLLELDAYIYIYRFHTHTNILIYVQIGFPFSLTLCRMQ